MYSPVGIFVLRGFDKGRTRYEVVWGVQGTGTTLISNKSTQPVHRLGGYVVRFITFRPRIVLICNKLIWNEFLENSTNSRLTSNISKRQHDYWYIHGLILVGMPSKGLTWNLTGRQQFDIHVGIQTLFHGKPLPCQFSKDLLQKIQRNINKWKHIIDKVQTFTNNRQVALCRSP